MLLDEAGGGPALPEALPPARGTDATDCMLVAEDLGVIPPFVHDQLKASGIPGMKILRWQKRGEAFIPPREFSNLSLATTGTHDTSALASWWGEISDEERSHFLSSFGKGYSLDALSPFSDEIHRLILSGLMASGSAIVMLPIQDILGDTHQINFPGTISSQNWRYRIPENIEAFSTHPRYKDKINFLKSVIEKSGRSRLHHEPVTLRRITNAVPR